MRERWTKPGCRQRCCLLPTPAMFPVFWRASALCAAGGEVEGSPSPATGGLANATSCQPLSPLSFLPGLRQVQPSSALVTPSLHPGPEDLLKTVREGSVAHPPGS